MSKLEIKEETTVIRTYFIHGKECIIEKEYPKVTIYKLLDEGVFDEFHVVQRCTGLVLFSYYDDDGTVLI